MNALFKRLTRIGPGGWKCYCCGPNTRSARGKLIKHTIKREAKRKLARAIEKDQA